MERKVRRTGRPHGGPAASRRGEDRPGEPSRPASPRRVAATFTMLCTALVVVVAAAFVVESGRSRPGLRAIPAVAAVAGPVGIGASVVATLSPADPDREDATRAGPGTASSAASIEDDDADLSADPGPADGWSIINTEGDIGAGTRAAYLAAALAHRPDPMAEPMVVHWVAESAGDPAVDVEEVARVAEAAYADPRGWSLGGLIHFERVSSADEADFVLVVAEAAVVPSYSEDCLPWLTGVPDASCTVGNFVIINDARWRDGALNDPIPLAEFRIHEINHETGHWLGQGHFSCLGGVAAVNQQQFRSLDGCRPNAWPLAWEKAMVAERFGLWTDVDWPYTPSYDEWSDDGTVGPTDEGAATDPGADPAVEPPADPAVDPAAPAQDPATTA